MKLYLLGLILALAVALLTGALETRYRPVARCPEDSVLVGAGQFESGYWDSYECGPAYDDYLP